jgi:hypothetical protein
MNASDFSPFLENSFECFELKFWSHKKVDKIGRSGSFIENGQERFGRNERVENVHVFKNERSIVNYKYQVKYEANYKYFPFFKNTVLDARN